MKNYIQNFIENVKDKFRFGTLSFIFIIAYVNIFQHIFGPENSIVGVIFTIMMSASMVRYSGKASDPPVRRTGLDRTGGMLGCISADAAVPRH